MAFNDAVAVIGLCWWIGTDRLTVADLGIFFGMFLITALGIEVGLHRYFSHRAFDAVLPVKLTLGVAGSMSLQGPVLVWTTVHRRHHRFSDRPGDPHSPNLSGSSLLGRLRGYWHVHVTSQFAREILDLEPIEFLRYAKDVLRDRSVAWMDQRYYLWVSLGYVMPAVAGFAIGGNAWGALGGLLWGGAIRIFVLHHITWTVNSVGHTIGSQPHDTRDGSRNVWWLALVSQGAGWHNNHHAFPPSARVGLRWWQIDTGFWFIRLLERLGLVSNVRQPATTSDPAAPRSHRR